jgi:hypothetical protein
MPFDGIPVVYDGGDAVAIVASVAERSGMATTDLVATSLADLIGGDALILGDGELRPCAHGPATAAEVDATVAEAEAAFAARAREKALDGLEIAVAQLGCLTEVVAPQVAARGFMVRAALLAEQGDEDGAREEVRTALSLDPDAAWPGGGTLDGEALLSAERAEPRGANLSLVPAADGDGTWIDGRPVERGTTTLSLAAGLHLAQHDGKGGLRSAWVLVGGDATLLLPDGFPRPLLEGLADPDTRPQVEALVVALLPGVTTAYVSAGDGLWLVTVDEEGVLTIELGRPARVREAPREPAPAKPRARGKDKPKR